MNARTAVARTATRLLLLAQVFYTGCPPAGAGPGPASLPRYKKIPATVSLSLEADPSVVDAVELVGELPGSPRQLEATAPGRWTVSVEGLVRGRDYRYRYRVHRKDLKRWILVSDPRAWLLDPSRARHSILRVEPQLAPAASRVKKHAIKDLIIYELCPREFVSSQVPHAHPSWSPNTRRPGLVFKKITARIRSGYFNRLGVNALQLMPITASGWTSHERKAPERDPWGYIPISWYALNGDYGTPGDLIELVNAAHNRGLAVLLDYSLDHGYGGAGHGKITDLFPSWRNPRPKNRWGLLELNVQRPDVRRFMVGALRRFLLDYGLDGFRMDWTENVPWQVWAGYIKEIKRIKPGALVITENPVRDLVAKAGFDSAWDFFFQWEAPLLLRRKYTNWDGHNRMLANTQHKLVENLTVWKAGPHAPPGPMVRYIESHDLPRIARPTVRWQHGGDQLMDVDGDGKVPDLLGHGGQQTSRLGVVLLATVPGAIMLFAGQEHGATDDLFWGYDPLNWAAANKTTLDHYSKLLHLRRDTAALRSDDLRVLINDTDRHLLVYSRGLDRGRADDDTVVVALNFGARALAGIKITLPSGGQWRDLLSGKVLPPGPTLGLALPASGWAVWGK